MSEKYSQCWSNINVGRTFLRCAFDVWVCCCFTMTMTTIKYSVWSLHQYDQFVLFSIVSGALRVLKSYGVLMYCILLCNCFCFLLRPFFFKCHTSSNRRSPFSILFILVYSHPDLPGLTTCEVFAQCWKMQCFWIIKNQCIFRWWFQRFFIFNLTWGNDANWLIFFRWVETTNQICFNQSYVIQRLGLINDCNQ